MKGYSEDPIIISGYSAEGIRRFKSKVKTCRVFFKVFAIIITY